MRLSERVKKSLYKIYLYLRDNDFMESLLFDMLLICGLIYGKYGYFIGAFLFVCFFIWKIYRRQVIKSLFTVKLFLSYSENYLFLIFGIINLMLIFEMLFLEYGEFETFVVLCFFKLIFVGENVYVQNFLLTSMIEDLYSFGEAEYISILANNKTKESLRLLEEIREQIRSSMKKSLEAEHLKTELITNISHDLKTPLTSIINYTDILSKKEAMDDEAKDYIQVLGRNSERLKSLIVDLIYASKTGSGNIKVEKEFIDFNELLLQIYGDFDEILKRKNVEFIYEYEEEDIVIYTDGNILSRIVQNLISNAYKYSKSGTKIYAETFSSDEIIKFSMRNTSKSKIKLTQEELLGEFVKSDRERNTEGSGLGLYITKNLVELLGGKFNIIIEDEDFNVELILNRDLGEYD
ncbi:MULTISPECIES: sensor histidine kinase KdpD [Peptoniphilus]|uniref:sensor histidine kinase n=1 Tax=Peptoniphilus TaxID=162289 RepID=UPI0001DA99E1|nr:MULTISPECIES: HAMP domain-containing sensor histidine kinase [Peptoniphilus]EFI41787.1 histidine kinase A domain protein [Peptoniphilus sp. oral taxon 386 str. F0131]